jgi:hypothetical protein
MVVGGGGGGGGAGNYNTNAGRAHYCMMSNSPGELRPNTPPIITPRCTQPAVKQVPSTVIQEDKSRFRRKPTFRTGKHGFEWESQVITRLIAGGPEEVYRLGPRSRMLLRSSTSFTGVCYFGWLLAWVAVGLGCSGIYTRWLNYLPPRRAVGRLRREP